MKHSTHQQKRRARQEGAVMLIVMLILLTATAMAAVSLQATQTELRSAGTLRNALQTQYAAEAAMTTTMAWVDVTSLTGDFYATHLLGWNAQAAPAMRWFGEPEILAGNRAFASRTHWAQQRMLSYQNAPLTVRDGTVARPGGLPVPPDAIGSFGPRADYVPGVRTATAPAQLVDYVVDMYDCQRLPVTATPGSLINDIGSGVAQSFQLYCVITSRGRSYVASANALTRTWTLANGLSYAAPRFATAHDARGTLMTPPILQ